MPRRRVRKPGSAPLESDEQALVCEWLDRNGVLYCAVPNGAHLAGKTPGERAARWNALRRIGAKKGVQDLLIFDPPPAKPGAVGAAVEMKSTGKHAKWGPEQRWWCGALTDRGWLSCVAYGAGEAIALLRSMGYGRR